MLTITINEEEAMNWKLEQGGSKAGIGRSEGMIEMVQLC